MYKNMYTYHNLTNQLYINFDLNSANTKLAKTIQIPKRTYIFQDVNTLHNSFPRNFTGNAVFYLFICHALSPATSIFTRYKIPAIAVAFLNLRPILSCC